MTDQSARSRRRLPGRAWWWAAAAVVIVVVALVWRGGDGTTSAGDPDGGGAGPAGASGGPSPDGSRAPDGTPSPGQTEPGLAEEPTATPRPVRAPLGDPVDLDEAVRVDVVEIEAVQGKGTGPGERDAPAVRFTIELVNDTASDLDLRSATVTAYSGPDDVPASDLGRPGVELFPSSAAPGETVQGRYVFAIPRDRRGEVALHVGYRAESPTAVFRGAAS